MNFSNKPIELLYIEDDPQQVELLQDVINEIAHELPIRLHSAHTGEDAIRFIKRQSPYNEAPVPDLILLDLYLVGTSSEDALREIRKTNGSVPVVIFSGQLDTNEGSKFLREETTMHLPKPLTLDGYKALIRMVCESCITHATNQNDTKST